MNVPLSFKNNWKYANQKSIFEAWLWGHSKAELLSRSRAHDNLADGSWPNMKTSSVKILASKHGPAMCAHVFPGQSQNTFEDFVQLVFTTSRAYWRMTNFIAIVFFFFNRWGSESWPAFASSSWNCNYKWMIGMIKIPEGLHCATHVLGRLAACSFLFLFHVAPCVLLPGFTLKEIV